MSRSSVLAAMASQGVTAAEFDVLDGVTSTTAELNFLDTTSGTPSASTFLRGDKTWAAAGGGKLLQVVNAIKTDTATYAGNTFADISGLTVNITLANSSNKILVFGSVGSYGISYGLNRGIFRINATGTGYSGGNPFVGASGTGWESSAGGTVRVDNAYPQYSLSMGPYIDSPGTTNQLTYAIQWNSGTPDSDYLMVNRAPTHDSGGLNTVAAITVMEID